MSISVVKMYVLSYHAVAIQVNVTDDTDDIKSNKVWTCMWSTDGIWSLDCLCLVSHMEMAVASVVLYMRVSWRCGWMRVSLIKFMSSIQIQMSHFSSPFQWKSVAQERHCSDTCQVRHRLSLCILHAGSYWCTSANEDFMIICFIITMPDCLFLGFVQTITSQLLSLL